MIAGPPNCLDQLIGKNPHLSIYINPSIGQVPHEIMVVEFIDFKAFDKYPSQHF
jgi:hypothetical protein